MQSLLFGALLLLLAALRLGVGGQPAPWPHGLLDDLQVNHPVTGAHEVGNAHVKPPERANTSTNANTHNSDRQTDD